MRTTSNRQKVGARRWRGGHVAIAAGFAGLIVIATGALGAGAGAAPTAAPAAGAGAGGGIGGITSRLGETAGGDSYAVAVQRRDPYATRHY